MISALIHKKLAKWSIITNHRDTESTEKSLIGTTKHTKSTKIKIAKAARHLAGVPIASYRDKMEARVGEYKLAYFRQHVLPIAASSDPSILYIL